LNIAANGNFNEFRKNCFSTCTIILEPFGKIIDKRAIWGYAKFRENYPLQGSTGNLQVTMESGSSQFTYKPAILNRFSYHKYGL
jgi:hypothetical protein